MTRHDPLHDKFSIGENNNQHYIDTNIIYMNNDEWEIRYHLYVWNTSKHTVAGL